MGLIARSQWTSSDVMSHILAALTPANRLAITVSLVTGLRIDDVLRMHSRDLLKERFRITEEKTLKHRTIRLPSRLRDELLSIAGKIYVFEGRLDARKHRTRQAVYKDIVRARKLFRLPERITPHSARKIYAVAEYKRDTNLSRLRDLLNHSDEAVTLIYAMADELTARDLKRKKRAV